MTEDRSADADIRRTGRAGKKKTKSPVRVIIRWVAFILVLLVVLFFLAPLVGDAVRVRSGAMSPAINISDTVGVNRIAYLLLPPRRGDVIRFTTSGDNSSSSSDEQDEYIRRIVALPGETIQIMDGRVYINGSPYEETYISGTTQYGGIASSPITLSDDEYFVMADNRSNNFDSRDSTVGAISERDIVGKVWIKILPYEEFGLIE